MNALFETELQLRLSGTDRVRLRREILQQLDAMDGQLQQAIRRGLPRQEFTTSSALIEAVAASKQLVDEIVFND